MKFICLTLMFVSGITGSRSEQYEVVGPSDPVLAVAGEDVILPCSVKPNISVVDMRVEWSRPDLEDSQVHLYEDHKDRNTDQIQSYRGRTKLNHQELQRGNASLKLSPVRVSDEGRYKCFIEKSWYDDATVNVRVEAVGSPPVITVDGFDRSGGLHLQCESEGWYPEPDLEWLDSEGVSLSSETTETHRNTDRFSVKHTIIVYHSGKIHCRVKVKHHMLETLIDTSNNMFIFWRTSVIMSSVFLALSVIAGLLIAAFAHKYREQTQLRNEKNRIQDENKRIQDEKNRIQDEKNRIQDENKRIQDEKNRIQDENKRIQDEKNRIQDEKNRIQDENKRIQDEKNRIQDENKRIQDEKNRIQDEKNRIQDENKRIQDEKKRIQDEKNRIQDEKNRIQDENKRIQDENKRIQDEKNRIQDENKIIQDEKNRIQDEKKRIQDERDQLLQSLKMIIPKAVTHLRTHRVNVILDADSAHPCLDVSDDGKQVKDGNRQKEDGKYRFSEYLGVLGKDGFSSGSFYFEVQVKDQTKWDLGVARESSRKSVIILSPEDGYWTVGLVNGKYRARDSSYVSLSLTVKPQRVGVFVDYEKRLVSFNDVESMTHIYTFTGQSFTGKLYPFVCLGWSTNKNSTPLIICD